MAKQKQPLRRLPTRWTQEVDRHNPLPEYPRPQLRRAGWQSLNGVWQYALVQGPPGPPPENFAGEIVVPFAPESLLSGLKGVSLLPGATLWYQRRFTTTKTPGKCILLHFGAVDQCCCVFVNGQQAGSHEGGYWPFTVDITDSITDGDNSILLWVTDDIENSPHAYGKQREKRGGIWYTPTSGIWQTVWLEEVPQQYIESVRITPLYDEAAVEIEVIASAPGTGAEVAVLDGTKQVAVARGSGPLVLPLPGFKSWTPDTPFLYDVQLRLGEDEATSYFGMRSFALVQDEAGHPRLGLNGRPLFHTGLLDQGYWSDGLLTPPTDEAMVWELERVKALGFNMLRKHIKIEPLRWYYHCDRLGILVWQDFVNGGATPSPWVVQVQPFIGRQLDDGNHRQFGRESAAGRAQFERDLRRTVDLLYNTTSLCVWVPFNEGWGQFDSVRISAELRELDNTRPIDAASGWHDNGGGDFHSAHVYYRRFRMKQDRRGRVQVLSEFGGYSCPAEGHMATDTLFGYKMYKTKGEVSRVVERLYRAEVLPLVEEGLSAAIYTQLSDVEEEINGVFSFDRAVEKLDADMLRRINRALLE